MRSTSVPADISFFFGNSFEPLGKSLCDRFCQNDHKMFHLMKNYTTSRLSLVCLRPTSKPDITGSLNETAKSATAFAMNSGLLLYKQYKIDTVKCKKDR